MGRAGSALTRLSVLVGCLALGGAAAPAEEELPAAVLAELADITDFTYDFDHPGFYAVVAHVRTQSRTPGAVRPPLEISDWRALVERPANYRGLPLTLAGTVGRNKDAYTLPRRPELGTLHQLELTQPGQAVTCTLVCTQEVGDLPLGAEVRVTGYFVKINQFPRATGTPGLSVLLVAPGPTHVSRSAAGRASGPDWRWMVGAVVAGLALTFVLLRRTRAREPVDLAGLRAQHDPPVTRADELAQWTRQQADTPEGPDDR